MCLWYYYILGVPVWYCLKEADFIPAKSVSGWETKPSDGFKGFQGFHGNPLLK